MTGLLLFAIVGGPLEIATVIGVTVLAMNVGTGVPPAAWRWPRPCSTPRHSGCGWG
jgi:hypothetical protein